jgi:hypothetical protein
MAALEDILGSIMLWGIFLVAGVVLFITFTRISATEERMVLQFEAEQSYGFALDSLLSVTEPGSMRSFTDLLGSAAYYRRDLVLTRDGQVHIAEEFGRLLALAFPEGNYYFEASAPIQSAHLIFILDGSDTMKDEERYFRLNFNNMTESLNKKFPEIKFSYEIYILEERNSTRCAGFTINCSLIDYGDIYFNETYTVPDLRKHRYGLLQPPHFGIEEEIWKSDWETALMTLILEEPNKDLTRVKIFLPITDSLPAATQYFYPCPNTYAFQIIKRDTEILRTRNFVIDPIFSTNSDPILYCDDITLNQMESLASYYNGEVIINRDNFAERLPLVLQNNLNKMDVRIGERLNTKSFGLARKLPMPNGGLADAQLIVYEKS